MTYIYIRTYRIYTYIYTYTSPNPLIIMHTHTSTHAHIGNYMIICIYIHRHTHNISCSLGICSIKADDLRIAPCQCRAILELPAFCYPLGKYLRNCCRWYIIWSSRINAWMWAHSHPQGSTATRLITLTTAQVEQRLTNPDLTRLI